MTKPRRSNPRPLTATDAAELARFHCFLTMAARLKRQGRTREEAQREAHAAIYADRETGR